MPVSVKNVTNSPKAMGFVRSHQESTKKNPNNPVYPVKQLEVIILGVMAAECERYCYQSRMGTAPQAKIFFK